MPRTINSNGKRKKNLLLPAGLDATPKFIQSKESVDEYINTPLAVSSDTVLVKGDLLVEGEVKSKGETLTGDNSEEGEITSIGFVTQDAAIIQKTSGAAAFTIQGLNGISTTNPSTDVIQINGTNASTSTKGVVELATTDETNTGTDTDKAVTPDGLDAWEGSSNIETLGTVGTGEWEGTAIGNNYIDGLPTSKITSGTMANARISESSVNQHLVWSHSCGGYKTNNNSASLMYFPFYTGGNSWSNSDSSPTAITTTDCYSWAFQPKFAGTLTNINVVLRASDTGLTDPVRFYVYKGNPADGSTSTLLTLIGTGNAITPVALKQHQSSTDISSSNTFSATDKLWIMYKKDSTSGNQDLYFSVTISGEYS